jgi:hypothetical protein
MHMSEVGCELEKETKKIQSKFEYPTNPCFLQQKSVKNRIKLDSVRRFYTEHGIPTTKQQKEDIAKTKIKVEHKFWNDGIHKVIEGTMDQEFQIAFVKYVNNFDFGQLTDEDKSIIFSRALTCNSVSHKA